MQLVCFHLGDQELGAPIEMVRETIELRPITPVFHTPPCVAGITNLRGEILAVLDPAVLLGLPPSRRDAGARIVIIEPDERAAGLLVDSLGMLREVDPEEIEPPPSTLSPAIAAMLRGIVPRKERPVGVIEPARLLDAPELEPFVRRAEASPATPPVTEAHG